MPVSAATWGWSLWRSRISVKADGSGGDHHDATVLGGAEGQRRGLAVLVGLDALHLAQQMAILVQHLCRRRRAGAAERLLSATGARPSAQAGAERAANRPHRAAVRIRDMLEPGADITEENVCVPKGFRRLRNYCRRNCLIPPPAEAGRRPVATAASRSEIPSPASGARAPLQTTSFWRSCLHPDRARG